MISNVAITITDGWAFRWLFTSGVYSKLKHNFVISFYVNRFYMTKLESMGLENIHLLPESSNSFVFLNSAINESYRNSKNLAIQKYYLSKYTLCKRIVSHINSWRFFTKILTYLYNKSLEWERFNYARKVNVRGVDKVIFLSPYLTEEIVLSALCEPHVYKTFVLPSWDNVYKYALKQQYDSYIVWGDAQSRFIHDEFGVRRSQIKVLGSITQYVFQGISKNHEPSRDYVLYCSIGERLFPQERKFVSDLSRLFGLGIFGRKKLMVRLHPADSIDLYKGLVDEGCIISTTNGVKSLHNWDVEESFFSRYYSELSNASLVINVASTVTLDCLVINQNVVNYNPIDYDVPFNYYSFEHFLPLEDVVHCCKSFAEICAFIKEETIGILSEKNQVINLDVRADLGEYCEEIIGD